MKKFLTTLIIILVTYVVSIFLIADNNILQNFIGCFLSKPYVKPYLELTIPILIPIITVFTTWIIFLMGETKQKEREEKEKEAEYEKICRDSRPLFYMLDCGNEFNLKVVSNSTNKVVITDAKIFYINIVKEVFKVQFEGVLDDVMISNQQIMKKEDYLQALYIVLEAKTMRNEKIAYIYKTDDKDECNLVADKKNLKLWKDDYGNEDKYWKEIMDIVDSYGFDVTIGLKGDIRSTMLRLGEGKINELSQIIRLIRLYNKKLKDEEIIEILYIIKKCLNCAEIKDNINYKQNIYFINNLIYREDFFEKYKKIFKNAENDKKSMPIEQMQEYIEDYIYYYQNNLSDKKYIDKDYALRNVEVYIRDNLEGNVDKENIDKIISIIKNIINNIKE